MKQNKKILIISLIISLSLCVIGFSMESANAVQHDDKIPKWVNSDIIDSSSSLTKSSNSQYFEIPNWVKKVTSLWVDGKLSDTQFIRWITNQVPTYDFKVVLYFYLSFS